MKNFLAIVQQPGNGCDSEFSIGCGTRTFNIEAEDYKDASQKLKSIIHSRFNSEYNKLEYAYLYELNASYEIDVNLWYRQEEEARKENKEIVEKEIELQEFNRIKQKYNL